MTLNDVYKDKTLYTHYQEFKELCGEISRQTGFLYEDDLSSLNEYVIRARWTLPGTKIVMTLKADLRKGPPFQEAYIESVVETFLSKRNRSTLVKPAVSDSYRTH